MKAAIVGIYTTPVPGTPLQETTEAVLVAGKGLVGDRHYAGMGKFPEDAMPPDAELTLIESEEIERLNEAEGSAHGPGAFRRNIVTKGVKLNDLVGRRFRVGGVLLEGKRLCEPCSHLAKLLTPAVLRGMVHKAGLRAQILCGGTVQVGDEIREQDPA